MKNEDYDAFIQDLIKEKNETVIPSDIRAKIMESVHLKNKYNIEFESEEGIRDYISVIKHYRKELKQTTVPIKIWHRLANTIETKKQEVPLIQRVHNWVMPSLRFAPVTAFSCMATFIFLNFGTMRLFLAESNHYLNETYIEVKSSYLINTAVFNQSI